MPDAVLPADQTELTASDEAPNWHAHPPDDVRERLDTPADGLSPDEAHARLERYGANELEVEEKESALWRFLRQFNDVLIYVLIVAAVVTAGLGEWIDTAVIAGVVLVNAIIGFVQEGKAEEALESIRDMLSPSALVERGGERVEVDAKAVVPGDIVLVESGDQIPADVRWLDANNLSVEEAILTGESVPVDKQVDAVSEDAAIGDRASMGFSGTVVRRGRGRGVVVATGMATEVGQIGEMMTQVEQLTTPLIQQINQFGKVLSVLILLLCVAAFAFGYAFRPYTVEELFMFVVGIAVAAIPEGLPAILTITLALGVQRMAGRNAILRKLPAVETLGSVSVICSDKTGTLTRNEMTVRRIATADAQYDVTGSGYIPEGTLERDGEAVEADPQAPVTALARAAALCSDATLKQDDDQWQIEGDPTEGGLVVLAAKLGHTRKALINEEPRRDEVPFESDRQWMATLHDADAGMRTYLKGAPERVLALCAHQHTQSGDTAAVDTDYWDGVMDAFAGAGHRLLAIAERSASTETLSEEDVNEGGFTLLGIVGLMDPPRDEAVEAVRECQEAGIQVKMITGDHAQTAQSIGEQLGIGDADAGAMTGADLESMDSEQLAELVPTRSVFARTSPEHKLRIMEALQSHGRIVAMTGDGVNDAPALKRADVGIAMGQKGAEATKQAADVVLADDNFATIAAAVREGRTIYDNLKKAILFILPTNGAESLMLIATMLFAFQQTPITPLQILWVNMVTAVTLALALAFEPSEPGIMKRSPRDPDAPILSGYLLWRIGYVSVIIAMGALWLFFYEIEHGVSLEVAQTIAVNTLVAGQIAYLFNTRFIWQSSLSVRRLLGNPIAWGVVGVLVLLQLGFTYLPFMQVAFSTGPVALVDWAFIVGIGLAVFLAVEAEKAIVRQIQ
ncbi:MAG: cation-transporting P-type ATPase [Longimonas sp.]|uniref:cation-transporting P-type ATPase n=1 Tax=Longimonas sp. TaxID=2039626 RepID=UPI00335A394E